MTRLSIATEADTHRRYCRSPEHDVSEWSQPGDVRRCRHGVVQLAFDVPGSVPAYWRDLSPVWTPVLYRRAVRLLGPQPSWRAAKP